MLAPPYERAMVNFPIDSHCRISLLFVRSLPHFIYAHECFGSFPDFLGGKVWGMAASSAHVGHFPIHQSRVREGRRVLRPHLIATISTLRSIAHSLSKSLTRTRKACGSFGIFRHFTADSLCRSLESRVRFLPSFALVAPSYIQIHVQKGKKTVAPV